MGVSPNTFEGQNRMPRPGTRSRSPPKSVPFGDPRSDVQLGSFALLPEKRIVQKESEKQSKFPSSVKPEKVSSSKEKMTSLKATTTARPSKMSSVRPDQLSAHMPTEPGMEPKILSSHLQTETFGGTAS